jgi:hypothetical protein
MHAPVSILAATFAVAAAAAAGEFVSGTPSADRFALVGGGAAADLLVAQDDWKVARIATDDLASDIGRVTGRKPAVKHATAGLGTHAVLVGTIGRSPVIDGLIAAKRLDVADVAGQWESAVIATVADPLPGVERGLVIAGSDRRGTAYGVYELSRRIGVSPWYWWADVTPRHRDELHVAAERLQIGPPAVKYRGIFINDEMWGIRPWAEGTFAPGEGRGLGPKTHAKIFELLLRLRANHLWPAMHRETIPFNSYPENKQVADDYAIVMGSSHIEPMLRNNMHGAEWDEDGKGDWDYTTNAREIRAYWARRLAANGKFENIYTLGMRGQGDVAMKFRGTDREKITLMEEIFADQRELLGKHVHPDPARVPQVFIPYTEVLGLYDSGMKVPEDVIICWPDDNFGYIRRLPTAAERARPGGSGIYYHIQWLNGATSAYTWLNTTPPALIWSEMSKALAYGADQLWVLNVGDIKPGEVGTGFFLDLAWSPERWRHDNLRAFLDQWAARDLDAKSAPEIAAIMEEHFRLGFTRRPEHLVQYRRGSLGCSWFAHDHHNDEAQQRLDRYADLSRRAQAVHDRLPRERKDAFFQLVLYPVQCAALLNEKVIHADKSTHYAAQGRASAAGYADKARAAAARIIELTTRYNTGLPTVGDKWNHMISPAPGPWGDQFRQFDMPPLSDFAGAGPAALGVACEGGQTSAVAGLDGFSRGRRFVDLFNKGRGGIDWKAEVSEPWLKLSQLEGRFTTEQRLWVTVDWDRAPKRADLEATVDFTSPAGTRRITVPVFNPGSPDRGHVTGYVETQGCVSMEAEHFTRKVDRGGAGWEVVKGLGRSGDSATVLPPTVPSRRQPADIATHSPSLEFDIHLFHAGEFRLDLDCLPTQPITPGQGTALAVSLDDGPPRIVTGPGGDVLANLRRITTRLPIPSPGPHKLTVWMVDPGVVLDRLTIHTSPPPDSYLGPPESFRR